MYVMWCTVGVLLCDVKSHTTLRQMQSLTILVLLCDVKSHTALRQM